MQQIDNINKVLNKLASNDLILLENLSKRLLDVRAIKEDSNCMIESLKNYKGNSGNRIKNRFLEKEQNSVKDAYCCLLAFFVIQLPENRRDHFRFFSRLLYGIDKKLRVEDYLKRAYKLKVDDLSEYIGSLICRELKYRFIVDCLMITGKYIADDKYRNLIIGFCEILDIKISEATFLIKISKYVVEQDHVNYWNVINNNQTVVRNDIARDYFITEKMELDELFEKASSLFRMYHLAEAIPLLNRLTNAGYAKAYALLYWIYTDGRYENIADSKLAKKCLKSGYDEGDVLTTMLYAIFYDKPKEMLVKQTLPKLKKIADNGDIFAEYTLGLLFLNGIVEERDCYVAVQHFLCAFKGGFYRAAGSIFECYDKKEGVFSKKWVELSLWANEILKYQNMEERRYGYLIYSIAMVFKYIDDYGCDNSEAQTTFQTKAMELLENLVILGSGSAAYSLAEVYYRMYDRDGNESDIKKAYKFMLISAERGDEDAQLWVAAMLEEGVGCNEDLNKAIYWYQKAAEQGQETAIERLKQLEVFIER